MCTSSKAVKTVRDNPLVNIDSSRPAIVKVGGSGASGVSIGTKGPGIVKAGGSGNAVLGFGTDKGVQFIGFSTKFGLGRRGKGEEEPPGITGPETAPTTGRNKELAIKTARAQARKRLSLRGRRKTILTGGQGVLGFPDIYRKRLLGQ